jgi:hypothetical protein
MTEPGGEEVAKVSWESVPTPSFAETIGEAGGWGRMFVQLDFIASVLFLVGMLFVFNFGSADPQSMSLLSGVAVQLSGALLALMLASFALFIQFGDKSFMEGLSRIKTYNEALVRFVWASIILAATTVLGIVDWSLNLSLQNGLHGMDTGTLLGVTQIGFYLVVFLLFYGILIVTTLASSTLRKIAEHRKNLLLRGSH